MTSRAMAPWVRVFLFSLAIQSLHGFRQVHTGSLGSSSSGKAGSVADGGAARCSSTLTDKLPYIIRSKYPGTWLDAELSVDLRSSSKGMASVEKYDPVAWELNPINGSNGHCSIRALTSNLLYDRRFLNWDGRSSNRRRQTWPRAAVEHYSVGWDVVERASGFYHIFNKYPDKWKGAELNWDGSSSHPMASVEFNPSVPWEFIPAQTISFDWVPVASINGNLTISVEVGHRVTQSWSRTETFSLSVSSTLKYGPPAAIGGWGGELSVNATMSTSSTVKKAVEQWQTTTISRSIEEGELSGHLWQAHVTIHSNHYAHRGSSPTQVKIEDFAVTPGSGIPPRCAPGFCKRGTGCQQCWPNGEI